MRDADFIHMREESTRRRFQMCDAKSKAYTKGSDDRLNNFVELGRLLDLPPAVVMAVYFGKHALALFSWYKSGAESSEGMLSTLDDLRNYLDLTEAMYLEGLQVVSPTADTIATE